MKKYITLACIIIFLIVFSSCRKNCRCYGYDGTVKDYSREEVKSYGKSCDQMKYMFDTRYYSLCEWD